MKRGVDEKEKKKVERRSVTCFLPDGQENKEADADTGEKGAKDEALNHDAVLQPAQMCVLHAQLAVENHQPREGAHDTGPLRDDAGAVVKAFPRQRLTACKQEQKETAAAEAGQDEAETKPPHGPGSKDVEAGVGANVRCKGAEQDTEHAGNGEGNTESGGDAESLKGAIGDTEADKVAVRAVT